MKPLHYPDFSQDAYLGKTIYPDYSQVPPVPEQTALKKRLDTRKSEILENLLVEFLRYLYSTDLIGGCNFIYEKEARKFLKKVGQK